VEDLARDAESLIPTSAQFTAQGAAMLADADVDNRTRAADDLLAKTVVDLQISQALLAATLGAEQGSSARQYTAPDRGGSVDPLNEIQGELALLEGQARPRDETERAGWRPNSLADARAILADEIEDALKVIPRRTSRLVRARLGGWSGLPPPSLPPPRDCFRPASVGCSRNPRPWRTATRSPASTSGRRSTRSGRPYKASFTGIWRTCLARSRRPSPMGPSKPPCAPPSSASASRTSSAKR